MKNIQLKKLELSNYRNIDFVVYEFDGNSKIIGENRIGKTNTLEAIYYLLTDKLLDGSSDVSAIKPLKDTKLEVRVKAVFDVDGKEVTLEKDYKENWVKTRGTSEMEMKGHTCVWIHNGVKQATLRAYNQLVSEDFGLTQDATTKIDFMQMLINPFYLGNTGEGKDWTELRTFIIKLVGDVQDSDIVEKYPQFSIIKKDLESVGGRIDQLKKKYLNDIDGLKTSIISDDAQIKMLEETKNPTDDEIAIAKKGIEEHQEKINALKTSPLDVASMELEKKINAKNLEISELEKEDYRKAKSNSTTKAIDDEIAELRAKQDECIEAKQIAAYNLNGVQYDIQEATRELSKLNDERTSLIDKLKLLDAKIANPPVETECPTCHRPYDESEIEPAKKSLVESALKVKEETIAKGKDIRAKIDELNKKIPELKDKFNGFENEIKEYNESINSYGLKISQLKEKLEDDEFVVEFNPKIKVLQDEVEKLKEELHKSKEDYSKGIQNNQSQIYEEERAMMPYTAVLRDREYYERQQQKLEEVKHFKEVHVNGLADTEQKKELLNQFIYTKLRMLDENVSKVFGNIKFQLIKENINGGYDAVCKPYIYDTLKDESTDVTWKNGSKSERVITGIAIAEKIKETLDLPNLPYLFDEGGEISTETFATRMKTKSQLICVKIADNISTPLVQKI